MKLWMIVAIELLMPGGTLVALGLLLYRRHKNISHGVSIPAPAVRLADITP